MTTAPPAAVIQDLDMLSAALDTAIPARADTNLLVATWNVRAFGDVTAKWVAGPRDSPKRDWHAVACIAEVISRFDVIALQEARRSTRALRFLLERLGPTWRVIASDVTEGSAGNGERLAFLYDSDRVQPSGLVGEIVLPPIGADPARQFARTPYFAGFSRSGTEFTLASVHVLWGKNAAERLPEVTAFGEPGQPPVADGIRVGIRIADRALDNAPSCIMCQAFLPLRRREERKQESAQTKGAEGHCRRSPESEVLTEEAGRRRGQEDQQPKRPWQDLFPTAPRGRPERLPCHA